jgi:hypothetical protein
VPSIPNLDGFGQQLGGLADYAASDIIGRSIEMIIPTARYALDGHVEGWSGEAYIGRTIEFMAATNDGKELRSGFGVELDIPSAGPGPLLLSQER